MMEANNEPKHPLDGKLERIACALEGILYQLANGGGAKARASSSGTPSGGGDAPIKMTVRVGRKVSEWKSGGGAFYEGEREGDGAAVKFGAKNALNIIDGDVFEGLFSQKGDGENATYFLGKILKLVGSTGSAAAEIEPSASSGGAAKGTRYPDEEDIPF